MVAEPLVLDVAAQQPPAASGVGVAALRGVGFGSLPGLVRVAAVGEGAGRSAPAGDVVVVGGVAGFPVGAETFA